MTLLLHPHVIRRWRGAWAAALALSFALLAGCATVRIDVPRVPSQAWAAPEETTLGRTLAAQLAGHDGHSGVYVLASGMEAFRNRAGLAEGAEKTLDLQYYIVHEDTTSQLLLYRVLRAAQRGVRVRLLIDDINALGKDFDLATFSAHANIEVRLFNPFAIRGRLGPAHLLEFLVDSTRLNRRMHNKLWIADNAAAIVGGRNLGDEYFDAHNEINFSDLDLLVTGPVVREVSASFDEYWNSELAVPIESLVATLPGPEDLAKLERDLVARLDLFREGEYARALRETRPAERLRSGTLPLVPARATAVYDEPGKITRDPADPPPRSMLANHVRPLFDAAKHEVILISPYFVPGDRGIELFAGLVQRGVRVRVLTNSLASTDVPVVHAGYARVRARLIAGGVEVYEMRPTAGARARTSFAGSSSAASLHAKAVVIDRRHVIVGSMNLDPRSRLSNTEVAVLLESAEIGAQLGAFFDESVRPANVFRVTAPKTAVEELAWLTEEDGKPKRYSRDPMASAWRRFVSSVLGALTPGDLL